MDIEARIAAFSALGEIVRDFTAGSEKVAAHYRERLENAVRTAFYENGWFTESNVLHALEQWGGLLNEGSLKAWLKPYREKLEENRVPKNIGVIMAGNIPLVGFHDMLCVLVSGHKFTGRLSSSDKTLIPVLADILLETEPRLKELITFTFAPFKDINAIIATGSDNTARYFEYYFGKYPHIIRRNRVSAAVLTGSESHEDLINLGADVFQYFGLGCRNVSKIYIPHGYDFDKLFNAFFKFSSVIQNKKYANNYDYNKTLYLLNNEKLLDNGFLLLKEDKSLFSPVGVLFYEYYSAVTEAKQKLDEQKEKLQCVAGAAIPFGSAQRPSLAEYADGVDTLEFLNRLK